QRLLDDTRPDGAPRRPVMPSTASARRPEDTLPPLPEGVDDFETALAAAERVGNIVRAALLRTRKGDDDGVGNDLVAFGRQLATDLVDHPDAVGPPMPSAEMWVGVLRPVV